MDPAAVSQLAQCLQSTLSPDINQRKTAEEYIKAVESQPCYSLCLIAILQDSALELPTRLAAAVTFKNFVKNFWHLGFNEVGRISAADRENVRNQLIGVMLAVSGNIQQQLSEAISFIWREDFPTRWPNLIPELVQRMAQLGADLSMVQGVLYTAHTLFKRYRHECASSELYAEMKMVIGQFGVPLTELAKNLLTLVVGENRVTDGTQLAQVLQSLLLVCKIFLSLNCQDLPEFFEDNIADWMSIFRSLLQLDPSIMQLIDSSVFASNPIWHGEDNQGGGGCGGTLLLEHIKSQVCDNVGLYASKYEPEFAPYLPGFVSDVWEMLLSTGAQTKYDLLIGNALEFLSSVISRPQHRYLFENPEILQKLCEKVILPNMHFRAQDEELFTDSPEEYMRLDLEGSNAQTRRRAACQLVHILCEAFEGPVIANFSTYIEHLLNEYTNSPNHSAWTSKDAALLLLTSVATRGKTQKHGVTASTELVNLKTFFENHVLPELQNSDVNHLPVIKADCLRYVIAFRTLLPPKALIDLLNLVPTLLTASAPVVHSYAAVLLDKILSMRNYGTSLIPLIPKEQIPNHQLLIERLLAILLIPDSFENVYVMKSLLRLCCALEELCLPSMNSLVSTLLSRLNLVAKNPTKPDFNHFLFETICLCIRLTCSVDTSSVVHFESAFFPIFQEILQQDISAFVPYVFQLLGIMLEQYPFSQSVINNLKSQTTLNGESSVATTRPSPPYSTLLPRLLVLSLWEPHENVPSLIRLMQSYLLHDMEDIMSTNKLNSILGVFQKLIVLSAHEVQAFGLLISLIMSVPKDMMKTNYLRQIFMVIFRRLQNSKTEKFMKAFTSFMAHFVLIYSPDELIDLVESIQPNLFSRVLEKVLIPYAKLVIPMPLASTSIAGRSPELLVASTLMAGQWRRVSIGLIKFVSEANALVNELGKYQDSWLPLATSVISGLALGPARGGDEAAELAIATSVNAKTHGLDKEERFIEIDSELTSFSQLTFAVQRLPELCPSVNDPRIFLGQKINSLSQLSPKVGSLSKSNLEPDIETFLSTCMRHANKI